MKIENRRVVYWGLVAFFALGLVWAFFAQYGRMEPEVHPTLAEVRGHQLVLEVVSDDVARAKGLGGHAPLSDREGMLFVFPTAETRTFWMKDMTFPIDIVWLTGTDPNVLRVAGYEKNVDPQIGAKDYELKLYTSPEPVSYVMEVRGGLMGEWGIQPGDPVRVSFVLK